MMTRSKKNMDRLSQLPEEILSHILSLMPTKYAVRTSVLSKRWRYAWTFVTNLDFDDSQCKPSFPEFVDWVLDSCKTSQINLFRLWLSYDSVAQKSSVSNWIDKAVRLNVLELHISNYAMYRCELPLSLFTCKTLTILRISSTRFQEFSCPVNLPSLKILDIVGYLYNLGLAFKFISGCPVLESLSLDVSSEINQGDYTFNIPTLKRLKLALLRCNQYTRVVLNVSNLECLIVGGCQLPSFVMEDVSSLVEASISAYVQAPNHVWAELLEGVSGVKSLSLGYIPRGLLLPIFPNLMRLELKSRWHWGRIKIFHILESCPKLKHLYIKKHVGSGLRNPKSVPTCLLTNLTTVKFSKCKGSQCDIQFLGYILGNAKFLKTVTITWNKSRINEEARLCTRLLKHKRASSCCEIQFHGSLSHSSIS